MTLIEHACPCWPFSRNARYKCGMMMMLFGSGSAVVDVDDNNNSKDGQVMSVRRKTEV